MYGMFLALLLVSFRPVSGIVNIELADNSLRRGNIAIPPPKLVHSVQFYSRDEFLITQLSRLLAAELNNGGSVVVIATESHREDLARTLQLEVPNLVRAAQTGRYVALDAAETLLRFIVNGVPDEARFNDTVGGLVQRALLASASSTPRLTAFGEMVSLLWAEGKREAALKLENLWNRLRQNHAFSLICAYKIQSFDRIEDHDSFLKVCSEHTHVVPDDVSSENPAEQSLRDLARLQQKAAALEKKLEWRDREERFRRFVEAVQDYAIFMLDPLGNISTWNPGAERMKGYRAHEIIGKHFSVFYPEQDIKSGKPSMELEIATRTGRCEDEGWRLRKDGSRFWANVIITAIRDDSGNVIGFGKVTRDITDMREAQLTLDRANRDLRKEMVDRRLAEEKLAESERSLRLLSLHLLRTQDEERRRIGRDLHDSLGQFLTALKMGLESLNPTPEQAESIAHCVRITDDCIQEVRTISYLLYPPMLEELGLRSAVLWYLDGFGARSGIRTTFHSDADFDRLSRESELVLFRVLQEGLTNVHRHSGSEVAHVRLLTEGARSVLEIRDEGRGISPNVLGQVTGLNYTFAGVGLRGMNERLRQLNGRIELSSGKGGTVLRAIVPTIS